MLRKQLPLLALIILAGLVSGLTMPSQIYPGDNVAMRLISSNLVANGEWGIPYSRRAGIEPGFFQNKGQYLIENDDAQRLHSRWGEMNTLIYAIPELFREDATLTVDEDTIFFGALMAVGFTLLAAIYLFLIGRALGGQPWRVVVFVLCVLYGTFAWNYLRSHTYEVFQLVFFLAFFHHYLRFLRERSRAQFFVSQTLLIGLVHLKSFYIVLYAPALAALWLSRPSRPWRESIELFLSGVLAAVTHIAIASFKSGKLELSGEGAAIPGTPGVFALSNVPDRLWEYTISPKGSIFLLFPLLIFSLYFWPRFYKARRAEAVFLLLAFALTSPVLLLFYTRGEFCLGPRYYLFLLPALSLPVLFSRSRWLWASVALVSLVFAHFQFEFNRRPYFMRQQMYGIFVDELKTSKSYFVNTPDMVIATDYNRYLAGAGMFPPVGEYLLKVPAAQRVEVEAKTRAQLQRFFPCNLRLTDLCKPIF